MYSCLVSTSSSVQIACTWNLVPPDYTGGVAYCNRDDMNVSCYVVNVKEYIDLLFSALDVTPD